MILSPVLIFDDAFFFKHFGDDDVYYYFVIAKNIINGYGSSYDGISLTNGYHPLWMMTILPIFALEQSDLFIPLRAVYLLSSLLLLSGIFLLFRTLECLKIDKIISLFTIVLFFLFPMPFSIIPLSIFTLISGLETPLLFFLTAALFLKSFNFSIDKKADYLLFGLLIALLILTRVDSVLYILLFPYIVIKSNNRFLISPKNIILFFVPIALIVLPYFLANYIMLGHFEPVSGMVKSFYGSIDNGIFLSTEYRLIQAFLSIIPIDYYFYNLDVAIIFKKAFLDLSYEYNFFARIIAFLILFNLFIFSKRYFTENEKTFEKYKGVMFFVLFHILFYVIARKFLETNPGYWIVEYQIFIILFAFIFNKYWKEIKYSKYFAVSFLFFLNDFIDRSSNLKYGNYEPILIEQLISKYIENDAIIAMPNSGQNSYYTNRTIVNLDGFVNSYEYLDALMSGNAVKHLKELGVGYILLPSNYLIYEPYKKNFTNKDGLSKVKSFNEEAEMLFRVN